MPAGRPCEYTQDKADYICQELVEGRSLRSICKEESMPCIATVFSWFRQKPEFLKQYEKAKEEQADSLAEEMLDIADDGTNDWMEKRNAEGEVVGWTINGEHVQRSRLRLDARKWIASKLKPKKYGERLSVGGDENAPPVKVQCDLTQRILGMLPTEQLESIIGPENID